MNLRPIKANMNEIDLGDGRKVLFSYQTPVAYTFNTPEGREYYRTEKKWSQTTTKHINGWLPKNQAIEKPQAFFDELLKGVK